MLCGEALKRRVGGELSVFCLPVLVLFYGERSLFNFGSRAWPTKKGTCLCFCAGRPFRVPVNVVECFFFSSGAGQVPGAAGKQLPLRNLVVRLAEKATEYHHRDVKPALGRWDDGYITVHGAWCEPLNLELVKRLNEQLASVQKDLSHDGTEM